MASTRSPTRKKDFVQYSKRLATWITVFWCLFRVAILAVLLVRPSLGTAMQGIIQGADDVMMVNIGFYAGNSVAEKGILKWFEAKKQSANEEADEG